ncbi:MAG TPA: histidine kinase, partial [Burkholderiaceae bacterium]|nr:histidine kinase [Burkholderiaceae bacterium]
MPDRLEGNSHRPAAEAGPATAPGGAEASTQGRNVVPEKALRPASPTEILAALQEMVASERRSRWWWAVAVLGFALTAPAWRHHPAWTLALGLWAGVALAELLVRGMLRLGPGPRGALALLPLAWLAGAAAGAALERGLAAEPLTAGAWQVRAYVHLGFVGVMLGVPLVQTWRRRQALQRVVEERALLLAQLQGLQAQIEPHFLFNTLAVLRSLVRTGSAQALPLLDRLSGFLEAVLPDVRQLESTLGREVRIVEQYLAIMALRLGSRLHYRLDVPAALAGKAMPPLLLQPLVENALRHGIEPAEAGGEIVVEAAAQAGQLVVTVRNTGVMPSAALAAPATRGHGLALDNLRRRL